MLVRHHTFNIDDLLHVAASNSAIVKLYKIITGGGEAETCSSSEILYVIRRLCFADTCGFCTFSTRQLTDFYLRHYFLTNSEASRSVLEGGLLSGEKWPGTEGDQLRVEKCMSLYFHCPS